MAQDYGLDRLLHPFIDFANFITGGSRGVNGSVRMGDSLPALDVYSTGSDVVETSARPSQEVSECFDPLGEATRDQVLLLFERAAIASQPVLWVRKFPVV